MPNDAPANAAAAGRLDAPPPSHAPSRRFHRQCWGVVFLLSFALYAATANRGIQWQDSGYRVLRVLTHDLYGHLGLALSHPLHYWLSRAAILPGWDNPAQAITLLSSLFAAVAVANVFGCVRLVTGNAKAAAFAAASLAVAHIFWQMATLAETYTLTAALLSAEIWCLAAFLQGKRNCLAAMFLINGLGVANHMLGALTTPVLAVVAIAAWHQQQVRPRQLVFAAALWLIGSLPYSALVAAHWIDTGDLAGTLRSALFGTAYADRVLNTRLSPALLARSALFLAYDFPNLLLPAAILGLLRGRRLGLPRLFYYALLADTLIHALFVMRYNIVDQQTFFLPTCLLLAIWGGIGAAGWLARPASTRRTGLIAVAVLLLALTPATYAVAPRVARHFRLLEKYPQRPCRDSYTYFFVPWGIVETSADRMAEAALRLAEPDGIALYQDGMALPALQYKRLMHRSPHVQVLPMPRLDTPDGQHQFLQLIGTPRQGHVVLVPSDVRLPPPPPPAGMKWTARDNLYVLERTATQPAEN